MEEQFTVFATRKDGKQVEVARSYHPQNLLELKNKLLYHSEEFDDNTRLIQKHHPLRESCKTFPR